jgi:tetratricopeptide (TPR) repeat protein
MLKSGAFSPLLALALCCPPNWAAQGTLNAGSTSTLPLRAGATPSAWTAPKNDEPFSPSVAEEFYEIARQLADSPDAGTAELEQALIFFNAALTVDARANYALPDLISCLIKHHASLSPVQKQDPRYDIRDTLLNVLATYVDKSSDLDVATQAVTFLLGQLDSREQREQLLREMLKKLRGKNPILDSELTTELGLLLAEKPDLQAATSYFVQAYNSNKYNKLAFSKLAQLIPDQISPATLIEHQRLILGENPFDLNASLAFADAAERLQLYDTAAQAYEYSAELFSFLHPSEPLPASIYVPWAISCYNTQNDQHKCLQIADRVRQSGQFDLLIEALAGKAAAKIGDQQRSTQILKAAEQRALHLALSSPDMPGDKQSARHSEQLGWFYCFALPDPNRAVDWANKAYSIEPNSPAAAAILACSLMMNEQAEWAKLLIDNYQINQIAELTLGQIQLAAGDRDTAIKTLNSAIARDPGSLAAERAKELLAQQGLDYVPQVDPGSTLIDLQSTFGKALVPRFVAPENLVSVRLNTHGSKFSYGNVFGATVAVTNNSSGPLVISDDALFNGNIRIDADISGDLNEQIPNLVSVRITPPLPIEPGRSILVPVRLLTGRLRHVLLTYPQASLNIEFTVYPDSPTPGHNIFKPAKVVIHRPGVQLTGTYLRNRLTSLTKGQQGQKVKTAQLFVGLLLEQHAMAGHEPLYKHAHADWMPQLLKSALSHHLSNDDWAAQVHTMTAMLALPLDYELINAVANNLNATHWPARLTALYLLAKNQGGNFDNVLDWAARHDSNKLVGDMATALAAANPQSPAPADFLPQNDLQGLLLSGPDY